MKMKKPEKKVTGFTIHYDDGTVEDDEKTLSGLLEAD